MGQLELFEQDLPLRPYYSDDLGFGLRIGYKQKAIAKRYIQHNQPAKVRWLVFDCDYQDSFGRVDSANLPAPNIIVTNRQNGHSHLFYGLAVPVVRTDQGRLKPLQYLAAVQYALGEALQADPSYAGLISKNPLHEHWLVSEWAGSLYELGTLADYLTLPPVIPAKARQQGLGRNVTLFEEGRKWAYKAVLAFRLTGTQDEFHQAVLGALESLNNFPQPLPSREVAGMARSISKWVWKHYTARWSDEEFSRIQSERGKRGGKVGGRGRTAADLAKRLQAVAMRADGLTLAKISEALEVPVSTVGRWCKAR